MHLANISSQWVGPVKPVQAPQLFISDHSKAVVLFWFSVACFCVTVSVTFHLTCVHIVLSSVLVTEWPPFGKYLLTRSNICSLCILTILVLSAGFDI